MEPHTSFDGPALELDFPGLRIGVAEYEEGPTGCTVFHFARGATIERDVRGGSPGTFGEFEWVDAVCFAGGSLYGLEAATGVAAELFGQRNYDTGWMSIAAVAGAVIFDWGPRRDESASRPQGPPAPRPPGARVDGTRRLPVPCAPGRPRPLRGGRERGRQRGTRQRRPRRRRVRARVGRRAGGRGLTHA